MADFNILTHETIDIFALKHYDNRGAGKEEFEDDLKRFKSVSYTHLTLPTIYSV